MKRICFLVVVCALAAGCGSGSRVKALLSKTERVQSVGFYGIWERPRGTQHHTAILLFGGSEGGLGLQHLTAALVGHGYPVLDIAYFHAPGLPQTLQRIRLEYFQHALRWLGRQPQVDPQRIVTFGISRGGELSLILASTFPNLVHAAVGYVPSAFVGSGIPDLTVPAWTYRGKPLFGWPLKRRIPVEKINGPVFVAGGGDDFLWNSGWFVSLIAERMHANKHDVTALVYPHAGHLLGIVLPIAYATGPAYGLLMTRYGNLNFGGSAKADLAARKDSWPKLLKFLAGVTPR